MGCLNGKTALVTGERAGGGGPIVWRFALDEAVLTLRRGTARGVTGKMIEAAGGRKF